MAAPTSSFVFGTNIVAALNNSIALNLSDATASTFKYALFKSSMASITISSDTGDYGNGSWLAADECAASGSYTPQGGFYLLTPTFTVNTATSGARMLWKDANATVSITSFTATGANAPVGGLCYWDSTTDYGIVYHYWGSTPVSGGTLTITWNPTYASGTQFYIPFN